MLNMEYGNEEVYESNQPLFRWIETSKQVEGELNNLKKKKKKKSVILKENCEIDCEGLFSLAESACNEVNRYLFAKSKNMSCSDSADLKQTVETCSDSDLGFKCTQDNMGNIGNMTHIEGNLMNEKKQNNILNASLLSNLRVMDLAGLNVNDLKKNNLGLGNTINGDSNLSSFLNSMNQSLNSSVGGTNYNYGQLYGKQVYPLPPSFGVLKPWLTEILDIYPSIQHYVNDVTENFKYTCFGDYKEAARIGFFLDCHLTLLKFQGVPIEMASDNVLTQHLIDHLCLLLLAITKGWHIALLCLPHHKKDYELADITKLSGITRTASSNLNFNDPNSNFIEKLNIFVNRLSSLGINNEVIVNVMGSLFKEINLSVG